MAMVNGSGARAALRHDLARMIEERLREEADVLRRSFFTADRIPSFIIDDLLPADIATAIYRAFPLPGSMRLRNSLRERKYVAAQMDMYDSMLEEALFAFQDARVVRAIESITDMFGLCPDPDLYVGGISVMGKGNFLGPHLDNSHGRDRERYRSLNLLYYVSPGWRSDFGGNLELWDDGPRRFQRVVESRFNRLVVMATSRQSWHSVSPVIVDSRRCCVSNYYFSERPVEAMRGESKDSYFHVTSFRGWPHQHGRNLVLAADQGARGAIRRLFKRGLVQNRHYYARVEQ